MKIIEIIFKVLLTVFLLSVCAYGVIGAFEAYHSANSMSLIATGETDIKYLFLLIAKLTGLTAFFAVVEVAICALTIEDEDKALAEKRKELEKDE